MITPKHKGQSLVEYGLIITLIAVGAILTLQTLGGQLSNTYNRASHTIGSATSTATGMSNYSGQGP